MASYAYYKRRGRSHHQPRQYQYVVQNPNGYDPVTHQVVYLPTQQHHMYAHEGEDYYYDDDAAADNDDEYYEEDDDGEYDDDDDDDYEDDEYAASRFYYAGEDVDDVGDDDAGDEEYEGVRGQTSVFDEPEDFGKGADEFGREFFGKLGISTTRDPHRGSGVPNKPRKDAWDRQSGKQQRKLLPDWVGRLDQRYTDRDDDDEDGEDDDDDDLAGIDRLQMNLDGFVDMDSVNDDQIRQSDQLKSSEPLLTHKQARTDHARFMKAQDRAIKIEKTAAGSAVWLIPSESARLWASNRNRISRVFNIPIRVNDLGRALSFYGKRPEVLSDLKEFAKKARDSERARYGDFLDNFANRLEHHKRLKQNVPLASSGNGVPTVENLKVITKQVNKAVNMSNDRLESKSDRIPHLHGSVGRTVKRRGNNRDPRIRGRRRGRMTQQQQQQYTQRKFVPALDIPVFSRAQWSIQTKEPPDDELTLNVNNSIPSSKYSYFQTGNVDFLSMRMGIDTPADLKKAESDAMKFFSARFGLDFSEKSGAKRTNNSIHHATLPLILQPYTVSPHTNSYVSMAEGNLASAYYGDGSEIRDKINNGCRLYKGDKQAHLTTVHEAGWMVRNPEKDVLLPFNSKGKPVAKSNNSKHVLPKGGTLFTGFWILERPDAPPSLLRFQSCGVPKVETTNIVNKKKTLLAVEHNIISHWDIYDMAQDIQRRPYKGVGRGITVLRIMRRIPQTDKTASPVKIGSHESRTMITIHH